MAWPRRFLAAAAGCAAVSACGCSPTFWRQQADRDVYEVVGRTIDRPALAVPRIDVTPDPRSRFAYQEEGQDCLPLPPDDPNAHGYMHAVDNWKGYPYWHANGQSFVVENPHWHSGLGLDPQGYDAEAGRYGGEGEIPKLSIGEAVQVAQLHNRDYQQQIENVYVAALETTFEQYQFGIRFLGANGAEPGANLNTVLNPGSRLDSQSAGVSAGLSRLLPSGAQLAVGLANNTLWLFGNGSATSSLSSFTFELTQPLLALGGRKIVLEQLTQAQRDVLYQIRTLARFRRTFFVDTIATGGGGGFLGLLQQVQSIRNSVDNIARIERQLTVARADDAERPGRFRAALSELPAELRGEDGLLLPEELEGLLDYDADARELIFRSSLADEATAEALVGLSDDPRFGEAAQDLITQLSTTVATLDVLQLESQLASDINDLREREARLQTSLDSYKLFLGLPTDFPLGIDDKLLEPFAFIDGSIRDLDLEIEAYVRDWAVLDEDDPDPVTARGVLDGLSGLLDRVGDDSIKLVARDIKRLAGVNVDRLTEQQRERFENDRERDTLAFDTLRTRLRARLQELQGLSADLDAATALDLAADGSGDPAAAAALRFQARATRRRVRQSLNETRFSLLQDVQSLEAVQIGARADLIELPEVDYTIEEVVQIALENRLDLRNARAFVTDEWRDIEIAKQQLKSNLDLTAAGDLNTEGGNRPFDFNRGASQYRFGLSFDTPLDQIQERNAYRNQLIQYQQRRRDYIDAEDRVKRDVRDAWRDLQVFQENFETAKLRLRIAARQYDSAVEAASEPLNPGQSGQNLGVAILRALEDVLNAQNQLISIFVSYERSRLLLARDMGTMEVLENGVWDDPFYRRVSSGGGLLPDPGEAGAEIGPYVDGQNTRPETGFDEEADAPQPLEEPGGADADFDPPAETPAPLRPDDAAPAIAEPPALTPPPIGRPDVDLGDFPGKR